MKKKINFSKIEVTDLEGNKQTFDISKELGNYIYSKTADLGELEIAREIYKYGEVELDTYQAEMVSTYIRNTFLAFIQEAICPLLENMNQDCPATENE